MTALTTDEAEVMDLAEEVHELRAEVAELREQLAPLVKLGELLGPMLAGDVEIDTSDLQALGLASGLMGG